MVTSIGSDVVIFRNSILLEETFIVGNQITLQAAVSDCSKAAIHSHPFSKTFPENTGVRVLLLVKLQTDSSE